jgi:hypothetical protein
MENESVLKSEAAAGQLQDHSEGIDKFSDFLDHQEPVPTPSSATESAPLITKAVDGNFLTAPQLAQKLNVSLKAIRKWSLSGRLMYVKMGRLVRYHWPEIEKRLLTGRLLVERS